MVFEFQVIQAQKKASKNPFGINHPTGKLYSWYIYQLRGISKINVAMFYHNV